MQDGTVRFQIVWSQPGRLVIYPTVILLLIAVMNGQLGLMQGMAWAGMAASRIPYQGLFAGIQDAVDGAAPCSLCKAIASAKKNESRDDDISFSGLSRLQFALVVYDMGSLRPASADLRWQATACLIRSPRPDKPPVPPPRNSRQDVA